MFKNLINSLIIAITGISSSDDLVIGPDTFYYNRTSDGMESGTIHIDSYHLEIHHGTYIEMYKFRYIEHDDELGVYVFNTQRDNIILFDPSMHKLSIDNYDYFINSTIKSNW